MNMDTLVPDKATAEGPGRGDVALGVVPGNRLLNPNRRRRIP